MNKSCSIKDCKRKWYARGFCKYHYKKFRLTGELQKLPPPIPRICKKEGCSEKHSAKGLCQKHYREFKVKNNLIVYREIERARHERSIRFKQRMILIKGGKCSMCGYNKNIACLDFHHLNPETKKYSPKDILRNKDFTVIKNELDKCILVCKNCHGEIHHPIRGERPVITAP